MPNTVPAAGEAMPAAMINRRRMLLGLAAASTAATVTVATAATPAENPELIRLANELPAIAAAYHAALKADREVKSYWDGMAWAPDELTVPGTAWPHDDNRQPGKPEEKLTSGYLRREGEKFPRRIVVTEWETERKIRQKRSHLQKAKKEGRLADCLALEEEISRLTKLKRIAADYEATFRELGAKAKEEHRKFWPVTHDRLDDLERHVAAIMDEPDHTMEGLLIKAQALSEWNRTEKLHRLPFKHRLDWHGQIAASILRHAGGEAS